MKSTCKRKQNEQVTKAHTFPFTQHREWPQHSKRTKTCTWTLSHNKTKFDL